MPRVHTILRRWHILPTCVLVALVPYIINWIIGDNCPWCKVGPQGTKHRVFFIKTPKSHRISLLPSHLYKRFDLAVGLDIKYPEYVNVPPKRRARDWGYENRTGYPWRYDNQTFGWLKLQKMHCFPYSGLVYKQLVYHPYPLAPCLQKTPDDLTHSEWRRSGVYAEYHVRSLISGIHWGAQYGHYLIDYLPLIMTLSEELRASSDIILPRKTSYAVKLMTMFGFSEDRLHFAAEGEIYFADVIYTTTVLHCQLMLIRLIEKVRQQFVDLLNLDTQKPSRYIMYNRKENRIIANMDVILQFARRKFPGVPFDVYREEDRMNLQPSLRWADKLIFFNQIMFCFGMHGSGMLNAMFMQSKTVLMIVETTVSWLCIFAAITRVRGMPLYSTRDMGFRGHWQKQRTLPLERLKIYELLVMSIQKAVTNAEVWAPTPPRKLVIPVLYSNDTIRYL